MSREPEDVVDVDEAENIAVRIKFIFELYPILSPTLLQAALGPQVPSSTWRPVLDEMLSNGIVKQETINRLSPAKRYNDYQRLMLAEV